ncbi:MAG: helix-turn-helix transcriptional regulator [Nitrospirae bacterium]|nr:helix-turn-helix transcriptional regulator [Nitrospirota bacterium]
MKNKYEISENIKKLRESLKLTQSEFAELIDLSENAVGKIERKENLPAVETLYLMAERLNVPIDSLFKPSKKVLSKKSSKAHADFVTYINTLSAEDVTFIHKLAIHVLKRNKTS